MTTNQLLDSLYHVDPNTTGILFASWFYKTTFAGNTSLVSNAHKLIGDNSRPHIHSQYGGHHRRKRRNDRWLYLQSKSTSTNN